MLTVTSLDNQTYAALSDVPRGRRVNGERDITLSFLRNEINDEFIADIETGWTVNFKGDVYHLFNEREDRHGNKQFDAVLDFFQHFNGKWHVDEVDDQSMTVNDSIRPLFDGSPYVLSIIDNFYANTMNYSRQQNSTERFLYFIGRHNAEFNIPIGTKTVQLRNRIGVKRDDIFIHEDDNLIDLSISTDTSSFCTAIKGYYRFRAPEGSTDEESTEKEPTRTYDYISPMAEKYGVIWGEPIWDERYDTEDGIKEACRLKQESTWKVSFDLNAELFENPLNEGDEIRFIMPSKKINNYIRVVEINEEFDEEGDLIAASYTFGNENISRQFRNMQYDAIQDVKDILAGRKPIPYSVLPKAVREATNIINAGDTTQFYYRANGIYGYNTENPLWSVRMNANGLGYSTDGGQNYNNAITHLGVVTEALTAGTIDANRITIKGTKGTNRIEIDGDKIRVWDSRDANVYTEMTRNEFHAYKSRFKVTAVDGRVSVENGLMRGEQVANIQTFTHKFDGRNVISDFQDFERVYVIWDQYKGRFIDIRGTARMHDDARSTSAHLDIRVVQVGTTTELFRMRKLIDKSDDPAVYSYSFLLDLQTLFGVVPDYRELEFYIETRLVTNYTGNSYTFRINRGLWDDSHLR